MVDDRALWALCDCKVQSPHTDAESAPPWQVLCTTYVVLPCNIVVRDHTALEQQLRSKHGSRCARVRDGRLQRAEPIMRINPED